MHLDEDILTVNVALLALVVCAETVAPNLPVVVDAARAHKAQIVHRMALIEAALLHVLVLGGDQRRDLQQIGGRLAAAQHHIANAADERLDDVLDAVQLLLGAESCKRYPTTTTAPSIIIYSPVEIAGKQAEHVER